MTCGPAHLEVHASIRMRTYATDPAQTFSALALHWALALYSSGQSA